MVNLNNENIAIFTLISFNPFPPYVPTKFIRILSTPTISDKYFITSKSAKSLSKYPHMHWNITLHF